MVSPKETCQFDFGPFLERHRQAIIDEWVDRLHTRSGPNYARRARLEIQDTVTEAFEADLNVLAHGDYEPMDRFISKITHIRLAAEFSLFEVQKAFELFREVVVPLLARELSKEMFVESIAPINHCLAYTIHRFSDHFQRTHEKSIREHNLRLENEVQARTAELLESEQKYKTLVEEISDGYFVVHDENIIFANRAFAEIHGCRTEEMIGENIYSFIAPESREKIKTIYNKSLQSKTTPKAFEYMRLTRDGRHFPTEIMARLTYYENKLSVIGICRDITERVKMEQRVREAERMATIGQITASLSHELRNPLSALKLNLQVLNRNLQLDGNNRRRLEISEQEVMRLERILLELLDFARPLKIKHDVCDINRVLSSAIELLDLKFKQKGVALLYSLDPNIPSVRADGEKLEQAFINLLLNAFEASRPRGRVWVVSRCTSGDAGGVHVCVEDEGPGISGEQIKDIFEPFFTTKTKGTGLGLTNVRRIVEAHGGEVEVSIGKFGGAAFNIRLPVENQKSSQA